MPVFISYKRDDIDYATIICEKLRAESIQVYLDVLDIESQTTDDITSVITKNILKCTHLIAVMSERTKNSWWVSFEIGEATISNRRIATFHKDTSVLPEYLKKWPIMEYRHHLDEFCKAYKQDRSRGGVALESRSINESLGSNLQKDYAEHFHNELKRSLR